MLKTSLPKSPAKVNLFPDTARPSQSQTPVDQYHLYQLFSLLLDSEHDLNRVTDQINNLFLYVNLVFKDKVDVDVIDKLDKSLYSFRDRIKPLGVAKITTNMRALINLNDYQEEKISIDKNLDALRTHVRNQYKAVNSGMLVETFRGGEKNEPNDQPDSMVNVRRADATSQFDNGCSWRETSLILSSKTTVGEPINDKWVYPDPFPKSATLILQKTYLDPKNTDNLIHLIKKK